VAKNNETLSNHPNFGTDYGEIDVAENDGENRFQIGTRNYAVPVHACAKKMSQHGYKWFPIIKVYSTSTNGTKAYKYS